MIPTIYRSPLEARPQIAVALQGSGITPGMPVIYSYKDDHFTPSQNAEGLFYIASNYRFVGDIEQSRFDLTATVLAYLPKGGERYNVLTGGYTFAGGEELTISGGIFGPADSKNIVVAIAEGPSISDGTNHFVSAVMLPNSYIK